MARTHTQWSFDYEDLSRLTDLSEASVRQARSRGDFNPDMLGTVVTWIAKHGTMQIRREIMESLLIRQQPKARGDEPSTTDDERAPRLVPSPLESSPKKKSAKKSSARS